VRFWRVVISLLDKDIEAVLSERDPSLRDTYAGAFAVLKDSTNPEFIVQSAHSFREFIEKLPTIADEVYVDIKSSREKFRATLDQALNKWVNTPFRSVDDLEEQTIINAVETLNTLKVERSMILKRRDQVYRFVEHEFSELYKPSENYLNHVYKKRDELYQFFVNVCHHQKTIEIEELSEKIDELNSLLRSLLVKTPTKDTNEIDEILNG
jgi:RNA processing factor Prp31